MRPGPVAGDFDLAGSRMADHGAVIVERDQIAVRVRSRDGHLVVRLESAPRVRQARRVGRHDVSDHDPTPVAERECTSGTAGRKSHPDTLAHEPPNAIRSNGGRASWELRTPAQHSSADHTPDQVFSVGGVARACDPAWLTVPTHGPLSSHGFNHRTPGPEPGGRWCEPRPGAKSRPRRGPNVAPRLDPRLSSADFAMQALPIGETGFEPATARPQPERRG
jgi:hypothetical protein